MQDKGITLLVKVITVYAGTIIGAGFASGQEILQFFIAFGNQGLWGVGLATILFSYLGLLVTGLSCRLRTTNYLELLQFLLGRKMSRAMDFVNLFILPGGLVIMLAGSGAVFSEQLGLPHFLGTLLAAGVTCLVILKGLEGILTVNLVLVPIKILAIALISLLSLRYQGGFPEQGIKALSTGEVAYHWAWSGILYVSYNMLVPLAVLSSLGKTVPVKIGMAGGALGGLILGGTAILVTLSGLAFYPEIINYEIPLLFIAGYLGIMVKSGLGILIWVAILTTAIADAHGFASRLAPVGGWRYKVIGITTTLLAIPLANVEFSHLVQVLYPLFGYTGLVLLFALLVAPLRKPRNI